MVRDVFCSFDFKIIMSIMHPKERCDINFSLILKETTTLIHAPAKGATPTAN